MDLERAEEGKESGNGHVLQKVSLGAVAGAPQAPSVP